MGDFVCVADLHSKTFYKLHGFISLNLRKYLKMQRTKEELDKFTYLILFY